MDNCVFNNEDDCKERTNLLDVPNDEELFVLLKAMNQHKLQLN